MALPFMGDWAQSPHPTDTLVASVRLLGLEVTHPETRALRTAFDIIGITTGVELRDGPESALRATIATETGEVTMSS
jgi:hypothetical protein